MTEREKCLEVMLNAWDSAWDKGLPSISAMNAALTALETTHAVVLREPTLEMIAKTVDDVFDGSLEDQSIITEIYKAMIGAAPCLM